MRRGWPAHAPPCSRPAARSSQLKNCDPRMTEQKIDQVETLVATPDLADALESEQFRRFLDQVPIAIIVSQMGAKERIVYVNPEFERVSGQIAAGLEGKPWGILQSRSTDPTSSLELGRAIAEGSDFLGTFLVIAE